LPVWVRSNEGLGVAFCEPAVKFMVASRPALVASVNAEVGDIGSQYGTLNGTNPGILNLANAVLCDAKTLGCLLDGETLRFARSAALFGQRHEADDGIGIQPVLLEHVRQVGTEQALEALNHRRNFGLSEDVPLL
jgi:hypothetical protein